mmetsp:Transcript_22336/g.75847  ORF Transcript_22336/g.75847 Transcript_22336/m.75847 type:complete len:272 (-) Transcript_22336:2121-2936(-)
MEQRGRQGVEVVGAERVRLAALRVAHHHGGLWRGLVRGRVQALDGADHGGDRGGGAGGALGRGGGVRGQRADRLRAHVHQADGQDVHHAASRGRRVLAGELLRGGWLLRAHRHERGLPALHELLAAAAAAVVRRREAVRLLPHDGPVARHVGRAVVLRHGLPHTAHAIHDQRAATRVPQAAGRQLVHDGLRGHGDADVPRGAAHGPPRQLHHIPGVRHERQLQASVHGREPPAARDGAAAPRDAPGLCGALCGAPGRPDQRRDRRGHHHAV